MPTLEDNRVEADLPMRQRLAKHRENAACASCHDRMDPVGFVLETLTRSVAGATERGQDRCFRALPDGATEAWQWSKGC